MLGIERQDHILDLGCGTGLRAMWMADVSTRVVGVDYLDAALRVARRNSRAIRNTGFVRADARLSLPFADKAFDRALAFSLFNYLDAADAERCLRELARVVRSRIVIGHVPADSGLCRRLRGYTSLHDLAERMGGHLVCRHHDPQRMTRFALGVMAAESCIVVMEPPVPSYEGRFDLVIDLQGHHDVSLER